VERWTINGSFTGASFFGAPSNGKKFSVSGISMYRIANGRIVEHWGEMDTLGLMQQLGMIRAPGQ
jgi:predicted ester cyclase